MVRSFWAANWRGRDKRKALAAFVVAVATPVTFQLVMDAVREQSGGMWELEERYRPYAAAWLEGERWLDDVQDG